MGENIQDFGKMVISMAKGHLVSSSIKRLPKRGFDQMEKERDIVLNLFSGCKLLIMKYLNQELSLSENFLFLNYF